MEILIMNTNTNNTNRVGRQRKDYTGNNKNGVMLIGYANKDDNVIACCPYCQKQWFVHKTNANKVKSCGCVNKRNTKYQNPIAIALNTNEVIMYNSDSEFLSILDRYDWERFKHLKWYKDKNNKQIITIIEDKTITLPRLILGVNDEGVVVDHCDKNNFNNCRNNLRGVTRKEASLNTDDFRNCVAGQDWLAYGKANLIYPNIEELINEGKVDYCLYYVANANNEIQTVRVEENPKTKKPLKDENGHVIPIWETLTHEPLAGNKNKKKWITGIDRLKENGGINYEC